MEIGAKLEADAAQFSAFVSYSHADAAIAKKLHRKIETYKLPKPLRAIGPGGKDDGRLGQIFRDREDLPAALDLSESVKAALAQSRALIVLCSPHAKDSPWVAKEIELFRELHPNRPILAALIDGEPEEAFPPALLVSGEPLAADLRKSGDGWRLGLLKLVAGVAEVPLDALVQRDSQRHIRSVMTVTLVVGIALLAMIGMTAFAIQQRNAAQHQQAQAEGLVEFMLTDLRTALKGVGRLDVMTDVNERAMDYYEEQGDLSDLPAESLERRARILHAWGEDDEKRGDLDKALEKFTEAHRVTEALLARDPDNANRIFGHAQSEYWVGYIAYRDGNYDQAKGNFEEYKSLAYQLVEMENSKVEWIREAGYADGNLCSFYLSSRTTVSNIPQSCKKALSWMKDVYAKNPRNVKAIEDLANRYAWLAEAWGKVGNPEVGVKYRTAQTLYAQILADTYPKNMDYLELLLLAYIGKVQQLKQAGEAEKATDLQPTMVELAEILTSSDRKNETWRKWEFEIQNTLFRED